MLFPELESPGTAAGLIGIAKLAADSSLKEAKRAVSYRELSARKLLSRCTSARVPFQWTLNPYRGCEFGCKYCYARYTHEFMELWESDSFETQIFVKEIDWSSLADELRHIEPGEALGIGTATDPYQPAERRYGLTRRILELLAERKGIRIYLVTKSDLVARDAALLAQVGRQNQVCVSHTITTLDTGLARALEPLAPRPDLRLAALHQLRQHGVAAGVIGSPVLPGINDSEAQLDALAARAKQAGASFFHAGVLFLQPCAKKVFFPFLAEQYPQLLDRYLKLYANAAYLKGRYPATIEARLQAIRSKHGLAARADLQRETLSEADGQLPLF